MPNRPFPNGKPLQPEPPPAAACRPDECRAEDWLAFLGHRWNALILWQLREGAMRFTALQAVLPGISAKVLTERLNGLVTRDLIIRHSTNAYPREVEYALAPRGQSLGAVLTQLYDWAGQDDAARP